MDTRPTDRQTIRQLRRLAAELADLAGAHGAATEAVLALARQGRPIRPQVIDRLIDELAALHLRAAELCGVDWPQILFRAGPLYAELTRRLQQCPNLKSNESTWN